MTTQDTKRKELMDELEGFIAQAIEKENQAMAVLENFNSTMEQCREATALQMLANYKRGYLERIKNAIHSGDIKYAEIVIRFHAHFLTEKSDNNREDIITAAQCDVAETLCSLIDIHFSAAS